jgi:hypothetical protein
MSTHHYVFVAREHVLEDEAERRRTVELISCDKSVQRAQQRQREQRGAKGRIGREVEDCELNLRESVVSEK